MDTTSNNTDKTDKSGRWKLWLSLLLIVAAAVAEKKTVPLKNLAALDKLFGR